MKLNIFKFLVAVYLVITGTGINAQNAKSKIKETGKNYPATFSVNKTDFDALFNYRINEAVAGKSNKYLAKSVLLMNTKNGDMKFLKLKLDYFKNAFLLVQVNGSFSTQVFIMSDDKYVFYKGRFEKGTLIMSKCSEDEIVSE